MQDLITFDEMWQQVTERLKRENPWTAEDEARVSAKSEQERNALEAWQAKNPQPHDDDEQSDEEDES